jgi:hypothetical protein
LSQGSSPDGALPWWDGWRSPFFFTILPHY